MGAALPDRLARSGGAQEGVYLILNYLNSRDECERIAKKARAEGRRAVVIHGDVTQEDAINKLVDQGLDKFGQIDVLVNNAGVMAVNLFAESAPKQWKSDIDINIYGPLMLTHKILPYMTEQHSGRIINLSSQLAINGAAEVSVYSGTKGFIRIWTQASAKEVGRHGVNVNCIGPGAIPTDMSVHFTGTEEQRHHGAARNPLRHLGVPHDVAE